MAFASESFLKRKDIGKSIFDISELSQLLMSL